MSAETTFTSTDGKRQVEMISLDGRPTFKVTDPRGTREARNTLAGHQGKQCTGFIPVRTIRQWRTIKGKRQELTLLAPITLTRLHQAGVTQRDLEAWGLVPPPQLEGKAS